MVPAWNSSRVNCPSPFLSLLRNRSSNSRLPFFPTSSEVTLPSPSASSRLKTASGFESSCASAALAVQSNRLPASQSVLGARISTRYDVEVEGEVDRDGYADLLSVIRTTMGRQGVVSEEFGGMEWRARDAFGGRYLTIRSEDGRTRVEALGNFRDGAIVSAGAGGTAGLAASALLIKATVGGIAALGVLGPAALLVGAAIPAYAFYRRGFMKEDAALRRAVSEITAKVEHKAAGSEGNDGSSSGE